MNAELMAHRISRALMPALLEAIYNEINIINHEEKPGRRMPKRGKEITKRKMSAASRKRLSKAIKAAWAKKRAAADVQGTRQPVGKRG